jgi:hypothetical protein
MKVLIMNYELRTKKWSGRADLNGRPPAPKNGKKSRYSVEII